MTMADSDGSLTEDEFFQVKAVSTGKAAHHGPWSTSL